VSIQETCADAAQCDHFRRCRLPPTRRHTGARFSDRRHPIWHVSSSQPRQIS